MSVESRDSGEELNIPAVKRKCVCEENSMSLVSRLGPSVYGESVTLPTQVTYQCPPQQYPPHHHHPQHHIEHQSRHSSIQTPSYPSYQPPINPPPQMWQPPVQSSIYQSSFRPSQEQPSYQYTEPTQTSYHQPSHHILNPLQFQNAHLLPRQTPHQQSYYQPNCQKPLKSA